MEIEIESAIKKYLRDNKNLLEKNDLLILYNNAPSPINRYLFPYLLELGVNPLEYLEHIPFGSCIEIDENILTIPKNVRVIDGGALWGNSHIESILIEENSNLEKIANNAIAHNKNLQKVHLPISLKDIGNNFYSCLKLKDIFYEGTREDWENIDKDDFTFDHIEAKIHCQDGIIDYGEEN